MVEIFEFNVCAKIIFTLMVSLSFFIGIILLVAPEAYQALNKSLQKEYGLKVRLLPKIENSANFSIDQTVVKYRVFTGLLIAVTSFLLLIIFR